jgi:proteasome lid subunit RPN8/RPN11
VHDKQLGARRRTPYPNARATIFVPDVIWKESFFTLSQYCDADSEGLVFWGGVVCSAASIQVTGLYRIAHTPQGWAVRVSNDEARWLVRRLHLRDEKLVAQVHSHPGEAFHSRGDDNRAASFHNGYLSIVAPRFAMAVESPVDCAVYEYTKSEFQELSPNDIATRIHIQALIEERTASSEEQRIMVERHA